MGRRERPLDPAEGPVAQFAYELRKLRREAGGITYRAMARQAHYSAATLAHAAAGERLASLPVALAYAEACGGDRDEWERRWHQAAQDTAEESRAADDDTEAPYPGLTRFEASDSERFFGRDHLVGQLVDLVRDKEFVVLTGPSGSGKSSLLRAGLIPRLQKTDPPRVRPATIRILTPGPHPARTHADVLDPSTTRSGTVVVVDQFEELFTLCVPGERFELWDVAEKRRLPAPWLPKATIEQCVKERIEFTPDGRYLGLIDATGFRAWEVSSGKELPAVTYSGLKVAQLSADGAYLVASDGEEIQVWRMDSPDFPVVRHQLAGETVQEIRIDTEAGIVRYLGGPEGSWGPAVHTLNVGSAVNTRWDQSPALAVKFGPDGRTLATARLTKDGTYLRFRLIDGRTGRLLAEPPRIPCRPPSKDVMFPSCDALLAFDSTGSTLAYGVANYSSAPTATQLSLYDIPRRRVTTTLDSDELGVDALSDIAFGADDRSLLLSPCPGPYPRPPASGTCAAGPRPARSPVPSVR